MAVLKSKDFKENMLLSFYNWPKVETSSVMALNQQAKSSRRQDKRTSTLMVHQENPKQNHLQSVDHRIQDPYIELKEPLVKTVQINEPPSKPGFKRKRIISMRKPEQEDVKKVNPLDLNGLRGTI